MVDDIGRVEETQLKRSFFAVLAGFLAFFFLILLVWILRGLLSPVLVGFVLAYVASPVVDWAERRLRWPRMVTALFLLLVFLGVIVGAIVWVVPLALGQISQFFTSLPNYIDRVSRVIHRGGTVSEEIRSRLTEIAANPERVLPVLLRGAARGVGIFATAVGLVTYTGIYITLMLVFFVVLAVRLPRIRAWFRQFVPYSHREEVLTTIRKISDAAGVFLRARLLISFIVGVVLTVGWAVADVPFWLVAGVATGVLNIIPYASIAGWLAVLLISGLGADAMGDVFYALLWPSIVYWLAQILDNWVLTPWLEGGMLRIHPVVVLFAILAGGAIAGILGMLVAIPLVAAWQICFSDVIRPRLVHWAETH
jgi:predicted PurR-regulated permease PerM